MVPSESFSSGAFVRVGHDREMRGVWLTTVWNINWPSGSGLSQAEMQQELRDLVALTDEVGLNTIFFQVRPEGDAFYRSDLEPWSRFLTGSQGQDPGFDPLELLIDEAHARGIEVHAWLNPYRAATSQAAAMHPDHMAMQWPEYAYTYGSNIWMDPGALPVQQRLLAVVEELVRNYEIDGIHFDDYFYPYPSNDVPFPDDPTWDAYVAADGTMGRSEWRRDNVNRMVRDVNDLVLGIDPSVRFGVSPFGIYRPGQPEGIVGLDQYAAIFADPVRWMEEGWLDYVAPQLYWPTTRTAQAYEPLLEWWTGVHPEIHVFVGNGLYRLEDANAGPGWDADEFREQVRISRAMRDRNSMGNIWFQIGQIERNVQGMADVLRDEFHARPALTPTLVNARWQDAVPPDVEWVEGQINVLPQEDAPLRATTLYRQQGNAWELASIHAPDVTGLTLEPGVWALATVTRQGVESPGIVVVVDE